LAGSFRLPLTCLPPAINAETQAKRDGFSLGFSYLAGLYLRGKYAPLYGI
jgi:hypothetical protein